MNGMFLDCYIKVSVLIALIDIVLAIKSFQKNETTGKFLGYTCIGAAVVDISYLISILSDSYLCMSIMSSLYFVSIDSMLICLLIFTVYFTKGKFKKAGKTALKLGMLYTIRSVTATRKAMCIGRRLWGQSLERESNLQIFSRVNCRFCVFFMILGKSEFRWKY